MCPNVLVFLSSIFEGITCVIVNDGTDEVNGGVRGWGDYFHQDAFSRKCIPATKQSG
jgi:hypothetical protein